MDTKMPSQKTAINNWYEWLTLDQRASNWVMPDINGGGENGTVADIVIVIAIIIIVAIVTVVVITVVVITVVVAVVIVFNDMMIAAYGQDTSQLLII